MAFVDRRFISSVRGRHFYHAVVLAGKHLARSMLVPRNK
jgi:hypothetical protein